MQVPFDIYEELSWQVEREYRRGQRLFIAGGDHSLSIGSVQGLLRCEPDLKVIWVDAHGDVNTRASSMTGSYHGMPLAFLLGAERSASHEWFSENLKPENLIYFGVRDLDRAEREYLDEQGISYYSANEIYKNPLQVIQQVAQQVQGAKVHLSVDCDAFDPSVAPATGVPVAQGLHYPVVQQLVQHVRAVSQIVSYEYVELNPQIFQQVQDVMSTAQIGIDLLQEVYANTTLKYPTRETRHGFNDRQLGAKGAAVLHRNFQMEKQGGFEY